MYLKITRYTLQYINSRYDFVTRENDVIIATVCVLQEVNHVSKSCCTLLHVLCFIFDLIFSYFYLNSQPPNAHGFRTLRMQDFMVTVTYQTQFPLASVPLCDQ